MTNNPTHDYNGLSKRMRAWQGLVQVGAVLASTLHECDRLRQNARLNNDLARYEANGRRELQAENAQLKRDLEEAKL